MKEFPRLYSRRQFVRGTVLGSALAWTVPSFLAETFATLETRAADSNVVATGRDNPILVVLQMAGGNDGLNAVVPFTNDHYHRARPKLGFRDKGVLKLNDELGLHPKLDGFKSLFDAGNLSIVHGVGYPNPNRSHFRSTEIWQTASDADRTEKFGWLGRYFDHACNGCEATIGVTIGKQMPQSFSGPKPLGISLENPGSFRFYAGRDSKNEMTEMSEKSYRELNASDGEPEPEMDAVSGQSIGAVAGPMTSSGSSLDFLERVALEAQASSAQVQAIAARGENKAEYPNSELGNSLKLVARLIGGGLPTRVFYVSQGGYDTHTAQAGSQDRLLRDLGDSMKGFVNDLKAQKNFERVLIMTFSEFGRRVEENANGGTDHGAAAPLFMVGSGVKAGFVGKYPSLAPGDLTPGGDLKFGIDFRSVYATVLEKWLKAESRPVLGKPFQPVSILA
jgi:uncharacterized protein (DUF1501 family)